MLAHILPLLFASVAALPVSTSAAPGAAPLPTSSPADSAARGSATVPDTTAPSVRVVRRFPPIEVTSTPLDLTSSQTTQRVGAEALRTVPADDLAGVLALQAGVVAQGEELHVRGGRSGETVVVLDGVPFSEPFRNHALELPMFALRGVDLLTGAPEARFGSGLAGVVDLHTIDPEPRASGEVRWQTDGRTGTRFDRVSGGAALPLHRLGLGVAMAADVLLDDTSLPELRTESRERFAGMSFGWRAENRMSGFLKLAPVDGPRWFSSQLFVSRQVHRPYDPEWTLDGWSFQSADPKSAPVFSDDPTPGSRRYRAADHFEVTDERALAALVSLAALAPTQRGTVTLGWVRSHAVTSLDGKRQRIDVSRRPSYGNPFDADQFHVLWGDYPFYRDRSSDEVTLRGDAEVSARHGGSIKAGAGVTYERLDAQEVEWFVLSYPVVGVPNTIPLDSIRTVHVWAPGSFAYVQGRWPNGGMVVNAGLRAEYWTPGPQAGEQSLPGRSAGVLSVSPRLGIAYPISVRDAFSLSYSRIQQAPARGQLYDDRKAIGDRQPLGNAALVPSTLITYEASVKHLLALAWSAQASVFYRDLYGLIGARSLLTPGGDVNVTYTNDDQGHAVGFEWSLAYERGSRRRIEAHYTWMQATGSESRSEGDPYGGLRAGAGPLVEDRPLSWDRRHGFGVNGAWGWPWGASIAWSTAVGAPLPWTPKPLRDVPSDPNAVNSRRLGWTETTNADLEWSPPRLSRVRFGVSVRNLFDHRGELAASVDGYPNPLINTTYDDYGAYRTETGRGGGAYYSVPGSGDPRWVPVHDPRILEAPRSWRASIGTQW